MMLKRSFPAACAQSQLKRKVYLGIPLFSYLISVFMLPQLYRNSCNWMNEFSILNITRGVCVILFQVKKIVKLSATICQ